jgi:hypothetical protein
VFDETKHIQYLTGLFTLPICLKMKYIMAIKCRVMHTIGCKEFAISKSKMDKIKGGKEIEEIFFSGIGTNGTTGGVEKEYTIVYDDGSFRHYFIAFPLA